jgi:hypothetical protein
MGAAFSRKKSTASKDLDAKPRSSAFNVLENAFKQGFISGISERLSLSKRDAKARALDHGRERGGTGGGEVLHARAKAKRAEKANV